MNEDGNALLVHLDGEEPRRIHCAAGDAVAVYRRWLEVLGFLDRYPSTAALHLERSADLTVHAATARRDDQPLLAPIDRWGHTPYVATALTGQSVATVVRANLAGRAPAHDRIRRRSPETPQSPMLTEPPDIVLDPAYYERGIAARTAAHTAMGEVIDVLDDVEQRADLLLAELLSILDDAG